MRISDGGPVLIVDDEPKILKVYATSLKTSGLSQVVCESDGRRALGHLAGGEIKLLILDLMMPHIGGVELLQQVRENFPHIPVVMMTAARDVGKAVECMKLGAVDFLLKPVQHDQLAAAVQAAFDRAMLATQVQELGNHLKHDRLDRPGMFSAIVTRSKKMRSLFQYLEVVAQTSQPVLIMGESGTGKELFAKAIHRLSGCTGKLVPVNVAGLDDTMFSDTLFGHRKGAFTGAEQQREGLILRAAGGMLFLDEIGDLGEMSQIRLLRLIQEREFYPMGSDTPRTCDARIVCASNRSIRDLVAAGRFRNDLFFRLNVHHVTIPPLRERKEDLPLLLEHFIRKSAQNFGVQPLPYPKELLDLLATYHFPGNVRELEGMVADAMARGQTGMLSLEPFRHAMAPQRRPQAEAPDPHDEEARLRTLESVWGHFPTLDEAEDFLVSSALRVAGGNQGIAATMLGLKRQTLNMRLKKRRTAR